MVYCYDLPAISRHRKKGLYEDPGSIAENPPVYHIAMIPLFFSIGINEMGVFNIGSVVLYVFILLFLFKDRNIVFASLLTALEIIAHMTAAMYFIGFGSGYQLFYLISVFVIFTTAPEYRKPLYPLLLAVPALWIGMRFLMQYRLLLNILPEPIADRLKADESTIADGFTEASIFFCDIVDFTVMSSGKLPEEVVDILNELFSRIDGLLDEYSMEKIKTIGDAYR